MYVCIYRRERFLYDRDDDDGDDDAEIYCLIGYVANKSTRQSIRTNSKQASCIKAT